MKKNILIILLLTGMQALAQDNNKARGANIGRSSLYFTFGADNSNFAAMNTFFAANNFGATYNNYGFNFGIGVTSNHTYINNGLYIDASHQTAKYNQKSFRATNYSLQYLVHYILSKNEKFYLTVFSALSLQTLNLRIDSIYDPSNIKTFGSTDLDKIFFNVPAGLEMRHYFRKKNAEEGGSNRRQTGFFIGARAACYFRVWQSNWLTTYNNNKLVYDLKNTPYLQYSLLIGF